MNQSAKPYRSKVRDRPRTTRPLDYLPSSKNVRPESELGQFKYSSKGPSFSSIIGEAKIANRALITDAYQDDCVLSVEAANLIYKIATHHIWMVDRWGDAEISPVHDVLFPCFHKSLISVYTAYDLSANGQYGAARPLLRFAFESLMIAKYCSINHSSDVFDRWVDGFEVYFTNAILKKIDRPARDEFQTLWGLLCETSHSSIYGAQSTLVLKGAEREVELNFSLTAVLYQWAYHLLTAHIITPSMRYYANRYSGEEVISNSRQLLRAVFIRQAAYFDTGLRRLVRDYRSTWIVR